MMRYTLLICSLLLVSILAKGQDRTPNEEGVRYFVKGGFGTSWIIMPKAFLLDSNDPTNNWQILPATNSFTGFVGLQSVIPLSEDWLFVPEVDVNYLSGEIRVDELKFNNSAQKLQSYVRIEVPLNFAVISSDNFWVSFGPVVYFTIADNKGFDDAVYELTDVAQVDSDNPIGFRFRLATYIVLSPRSYIDIKFESDLSRNFEFKDDVYHMKMSMQNITIGFGYKLKKKH